METLILTMDPTTRVRDLARALGDTIDDAEWDQIEDLVARDYEITRAFGVQMRMAGFRARGQPEDTRVYDCVTGGV